jgi:hypothetical protein
MKSIKITKTICFIIIGFILIAIVFLYFKINNGAIGQENFDKYRSYYTDLGLPGTNHTVNLPINTTFECENKCMPPARCSITGEQCSTDIDCCGCNPNAKKIQQLLEEGVDLNDINNEVGSIDKFVEGFFPKNLGEGFFPKNLGEGFFPKNLGEGFTQKNLGEGFTADQLKSAYGNDAKNKVTDLDLFTKERDLFSKPPQYYLGEDMWTKSFYEGAKLFNDAHDPNIQKARYAGGPDPGQFQLKYPDRTTLSGLFVENGPLTIADV